MVELGADAPQQLVRGKWLLQEVAVHAQRGVRAQHFVGIAAAINDFKRGFIGQRFFRQFPPAQAARHHHVGDEHVNAGPVLLPNPPGCHAGFRFVNAVAFALENEPGKPPQGGFVLHQQDGFVASRGRAGGRAPGQGGGGLGQLRKVNVKSRAGVDLTFNFDPALVLFNNAKDGGQTQPGPFAWLLGGEERLEDVGQVLRGNVRPATWHRGN